MGIEERVSRNVSPLHLFHKSVGERCVCVGEGGASVQQKRRSKKGSCLPGVRPFGLCCVLRLCGVSGNAKKEGCVLFFWISLLMSVGTARWRVM